MMSEEKGTPVRFKEILRKVQVKYSTPEEVPSTITRNRLSLNSYSFLSPVPKKSFEPNQPFEDGPQLTKERSFQGLLQRKLSICSSLASDTPDSSQFMFLRRKLSTIIGSEGSNEAPGQADVPSVTPNQRTRNSSELRTATIVLKESNAAPDQVVFPSQTPSKRHRNSSTLISKNWEVTTRRVSALKISTAKKKKKKLDKKLVVRTCVKTCKSLKACAILQ